MRGAFLNEGVLPNTKDTNFRAVQDNWYVTMGSPTIVFLLRSDTNSFCRPVFGFSSDLGSVGSSTVSTLYTLGMTQDGAINLLGEGSDLTTYPALWQSYFDSAVDAVSFTNDVKCNYPV